MRKALAFATQSALNDLFYHKTDKSHKLLSLRKMKLFSHYAFSFGVSLATFGAISRASFVSFGTESKLSYVFSLFVISAFTNKLIDALGHEIRGGFASRSPRTHTLSRAGLIGAFTALGVSLALPYVLASIQGDPVYAVRPFQSDSAFFIAFSPFLGFVCGSSHIILDAFTERGVYTKKKGRWVRIAFAHFTYDNPLLNFLALLFGAVFAIFGARLLGLYF
jgi:hypothetical protein